MAAHSSILAWKIPRTEEPGGLQSPGSHRWTRLSGLAGRPAWERGLQYQEVATRWRPEEAFPESQAQPPTGGVAGLTGQGNLPVPRQELLPRASGRRGFSSSLPDFTGRRQGSQDHPDPLRKRPGEGSFKLPGRVQQVHGEQGGGPPPPKRVSRSGWPQPPCTVTKLPKFSGRRGGWIRIPDCSGDSLGTLLRATGHGTEGPTSSGDTVPHEDHFSRFQYQITFEHFY